MKLITRKGNAKLAADSFYKSNFIAFGGVWRFEGREDTHSKLVGLGENPNPDDVDAITGNTSWTSCICNECYENVEAMVEIGQEPDYDSSTAYICLSCLSEALKLLDS